MGLIFLKTPSHCPYLSLFLVVCVAAWAGARSGNSSGVAGQPAKIPIKLGYITGCENTLENFYDRPGRLISGALTYAVEQINNDSSILPNHTLEWIIAETYGVETESIKQTALLLRKGISVYIGPQETCVHEGRIAAAFNLPMISYVSMSLSWRF